MFKLQEKHREDWGRLGHHQDDYKAYVWIIRSGLYAEAKYRTFVLRMLELETQLDVSISCVPMRYYVMPLHNLEAEFEQEMILSQF